VTRLRAGRPEFDSTQEQALLVTEFRPALGSTRSPIQQEPGDLSPGVKWPGHEADNSTLSIAQVKNVWSYTSTPPYAFVAWYLVKHKGNFTFLSYFY
jgi:hypothetical protein